MLGAKELNRLDIKNRTPTPDGIQDFIIELLNEAWPQFNTLLVLDQVSEADCGVVTAKVREHLAKVAESDPSKFVLADSRERIRLFKNVCVKPNREEIMKAVRDLTWSEDSEEIQFTEACLDLSWRYVKRPAFVTLGNRGIRYVRPAPIGSGAAAWDISAYPVSGPIDFCGAGDSCSAGIACAMVSGATHEQAAAFGNLVASITIQQLGVTGTATPEQVRARWREVGSRA